MKKTVSNSGDMNGTFRMIYNQSWQLLEIRSVSGGSTAVEKQFVHAGPGTFFPSSLSPSVPAPYIDDHVAMLSPSGGSWTAHYYHSDGLFNTLAMTDGSAAVAQRTQFEPYGTAALTSGGGSPLSTSAVGNPFQRQGIVRDWETANDENRRRWYGPPIGRWGQRDPVATRLSARRTAALTWRSFRQSHRTNEWVNLYRYLDGRIVAGVDPSGLATVLVYWQVSTTWYWDPFTGLHRMIARASAYGECLGCGQPDENMLSAQSGCGALCHGIHQGHNPGFRICVNSCITDAMGCFVCCTIEGECDSVTISGRFGIVFVNAEAEAHEPAY